MSYCNTNHVGEFDVSDMLVVVEGNMADLRAFILKAESSSSTEAFFVL